MPLTFSHPAAVLPFRRVGLPVTAMVVGSMVPDLPLFLRWQHLFRWQHGYHLTHSLPGVATVDVVLTLVLVWLWFALVRDVLVDLSPATVRSRLAPHVSLSLQQWCLVVPAAVVGALTHVLWDAFTHGHRWGVDLVGWLQLEHAGLPGYRWVQYASGVIGLAVVLAAAGAHLRALPPARPPASRPTWILPAIVAVALGVGCWTALTAPPGDVRLLALHSVLNTVFVAVLCLAVLCLAWRGRRSYAPAP